MQEIIIVTHNKLIISVPVEQLIKMEPGDSVAGAILINVPEKPKEI